MSELNNIVVETNVAVPMRDRVVLRADVYRPAAEGRYPVLILRTPYGKDGVIADGSEPTVLRGARSGYVVVAEDVRGRYHSDGVFNPYRNEGKDGYDTIEWAAAQPWSNGKVGTFGLSYPGAVQWLAAMEAPPHLLSMSPAMTFASARHFFYFGGAFNHDWMRWILNYIAPEERRRRRLTDGPLDEKAAEALWAQNKWALERFLPTGDLPQLKMLTPWYVDWLEHPDDGPDWAFADVTSAYPRINVPALSLSGWHDSNYGPIGATTNFNGMRERGATREARAAQRLVMGPWDHGDPGIAETKVGDLDFGENAPIDYYGLILRWHDRWLKGIRNGVDEGPPIRLFVMGENVWRDENEWPLERAQETALYLRGNNVVGGKESGYLKAEAPPANEAADRYDYDPRDPVVIENFEAMGPRDRSGLVRRRDLLVYSTPPLDQDLEVTGPVTVRLWVSSSAVDTDFMVMLLDVFPDGKAYNVMPLEAGVLRARYRESQASPKLLTPGEPVELVIGDMVTSNLFRRGHCIRLHVTSSRFPVFDRNLNTGEPPARAARMVTARQTILHDAAHPSRLILPIVPRASR